MSVWGAAAGEPRAPPPLGRRARHVSFCLNLFQEKESRSEHLWKKTKSERPSRTDVFSSISKRDLCLGKTLDRPPPVPATSSRFWFRGVSQEGSLRPSPPSASHLWLWGGCLDPPPAPLHPHPSLKDQVCVSPLHLPRVSIIGSGFCCRRKDAIRVTLCHDTGRDGGHDRRNLQIPPPRFSFWREERSHPCLPPLPFHHI